MRPERRQSVGLVLAIAVVVVACGGGPTPSPSAVAIPSPTRTPDPHLTEPASINAIFSKLDSAGLKVKANNADQPPSGEPRKRINATYAGWPLILSEYSSSAALRSGGRFDPSKKPAADDPPYAFAGLNILVEYGPRTPGPDAAPEQRFHSAAIALILVLDPLVGPLQQRSVDPLPLRGASSPAPSAAPSPSPS
jgi:hypothetical protein